MAEPSSTVCREQASIWETRAAETNLPQQRQSFLGSAAAWTARAEQIERSAALREARAKPVEVAAE
ncbi:hypothetical protein ACFOMD_00770 [Sphingoaurantiacus capsulatus]|uniref:Uncharacterized protein n=1 Tax=Sphingoaurantiacus capsulatus TaxID=1771310 RepID=A0ABV7X548_9SPHN